MSVPLVVRHGRLLTSARQYRLAVEELSNQLERLTALPSADVAAAVDKLKVSELTAAKLPGAELTANIEPAEYGRRVTLQIAWDEPQRLRDAAGDDRLAHRRWPAAQRRDAPEEQP